MITSSNEKSHQNYHSILLALSRLTRRNVEEMKGVQDMFYVNILLQVFYSSNICLSSGLKNFAKCRGRHLCWGLFFNKFEGSVFIKKRLWDRYSPENLSKF